MIPLAELERDLVILACAISAGIHGALTPAHFDKGTGAGLGFLGATVALAAVVVALARRPGDITATAGAALVLAGLLGSYALAITSGVPLLHPPEPVDGLALFTKAVEAAGLLATAHLIWHERPALAPVSPRPKGTTT